MKKFLSLILMTVMLFSLLLTGCAKDKFLGTYSFRMGKVEGKHFSISLELTNEDYKVGNEVLGKTFSITFDFLKMVDLGEETEEPLVDLGRFEDGITINGYYNLGEETEKGTRLIMGFSFGRFIDEIDSKYGDIIEEFWGESLHETVGDFTIENEIIELLFYAHVDKSQVIMVVPVSYEDLKYQLFWYGYDIDIEDEELKEVEKHEVGTHPTAEDVEKINQTYPDNHKTVMYDENGDEMKNDNGEVMYYPGEYYRDFYTIDLALLKE